MTEALDGLTQSPPGLRYARECYGKQVIAGDLWCYIYWALHIPDLRSRFSEELENSAPRFPWVSADASPIIGRRARN